MSSTNNNKKEDKTENTSNNEEQEEHQEMTVNILSYDIVVDPTLKPIDYLINIPWLDGKLKQLKQDIINDHELTLKTPTTSKYYNSLDNVLKHFHYNKTQFKKLEEFTALILAYLIQPAEKSGRYDDRGGSCYIGAGFNVICQDTPRRKRIHYFWCYNANFGDNGESQKLIDMDEIYKYYDVKVLIDWGRMD